MTDLTREGLYELPIRKLNLPVKAFNACARRGMTTVGDCVDSVELVLFPSRAGFLHHWWHYEELADYLLPIIIERGYWKPDPKPDDFAPEIIEELKQKLSEKGYLPDKELE